MTMREESFSLSYRLREKKKRRRKIERELRQGGTDHHATKGKKGGFVPPQFTCAIGVIPT